MLRAWLIDNSSQHWSVGCYFVQFQKNSSFHRTIKRTPYKALFGTEPRTGLESTHIPKDLLDKLTYEEDLDLILKQRNINIIAAAGSTDDQDITMEVTNDYAVLTPKDSPTYTSHSQDLDSQDETTADCSNNDELITLNDLQLCTQNTPINIINNLDNYHDDDDDNDLPAVHLNNHTASTLNNLITIEIATNDKESMVLNSGIDNSEKKIFCVVCEMECTGAHTCGICGYPVHAICGITAGEEGYGSVVECKLCEKENRIRTERENAAKCLKKSADIMKETSLHKFKDLQIKSSVLVDVPKVDRGPLDGNNVPGIVLNIKNNLFQIGTSAGIIKNWLPRNALQPSTSSFTAVIPTKHSLREIAAKLSLFGGQGFKKCSCEKSKVQCKTNRCACKKNNVMCNSRCHKSTKCCNK